MTSFTGFVIYLDLWWEEYVLTKQCIDPRTQHSTQFDGDP